METDSERWTNSGKGDREMKKILGLTAIVAVSLGLAFAACDTGSGNDGNDEKEDVKLPEGEVGEEADVSGQGDVPSFTDEVNGDHTPCPVQCDGKECGDNGCGGSCGSCQPGVTCVNFKCEVDEECADKECGPDGKGGYCGNGDAATLGCGAGFECNVVTSLCEKVEGPNCEGKQCGPDGAGGTCGTCPCDGCDPEFVKCDLETGLCGKEDICQCPDIFECLNGCPEGDQACYGTCINSCPVDEQMKFQNLVTCLDQSGYWDCPENDDECLNAAFDQCYDLYADCFAIGDAACVDMYLCLISCPEVPEGEPNECSSDCFGSGTKEAWGLWDEFIGCLDENGYFDCPDGDDACVEAAWESCSVEFQACAHGDTSCKGVFDCLETCAPTDQICGLSCYVHGSIAGQTAFDGVVDCISEQCGEQGTAECEQQALTGACSGLYNDCLGM